MMENIEGKLEDYRIRKKRQEKLQHIAEAIKGCLRFGVEDKNTSEPQDKGALVVHESDSELSSPTINTDSAVLSSDEEITIKGSGIKNSSFSDCVFLNYALHVIYIAFWCSLFVIAIELQFGIVFLMFSTLAGIYLNTRTGPKKRHEISAYSVFNENCESIDGTLKPEQFEREIGIRK